MSEAVAAQMSPKLSENAVFQKTVLKNLIEIFTKIINLKTLTTIMIDILNWHLEFLH